MNQQDLKWIEVFQKIMKMIVLKKTINIQRLKRRMILIHLLNKENNI